MYNKSLEFKEINSRRNQLLLIILLVLLIRVIYIDVSTYKKNNAFYFNDEKGYNRLALNIADGKGFVLRVPDMLMYDAKPTSMREPLYPLFLAACYKIIGYNLSFVRILQALIDCVTAIFIYLIIKQIFVNENIALLGSLLFAVYMPEVTFVPRVLPIVFISLTIVIFIHFLLKSYLNPSFINYFATGICLGISTLSKATMEFFILVLFCWIIFKYKKSRKTILKAILAVSVGFFLSIAPWAIRNYFLFRSFIPSSTAGGFNLFIGNDFKTQGAAFTLLLSMLDKSLKKELLAANEHERDLIFRREAFKRIINEPQKFIFLSIKKFFRFWFNIGYGRDPSLGSYMVSLVNLCLIILSAIGISRISGAVERGLPVILLILYFNLFHMAVVAGIHYMIPIAPLLIVFSSAGVFYIFEKFLKRRS